ncbi:MAG: hypothetical protein HFJ51_06070 [Clostridia bacterium]|nr:hypothetical protein [Clostridia bacterium]
MKKIINAFINTSVKIKCIIVISTIIVLTTGITVTAHFLGEQNNVKAAVNNEPEEIIEDFEIIENTQEEALHEEEAQEEEAPEEDIEEEEKTKPKTVTYQDKTVTVPKSTVAAVNSSEDAEKDKEKGGEEVAQEKVEEMFENIGQKSMGIDVSAHQGVIDWSQVKASGVDFAMIRVGFRGQTQGSIFEDKYFKSNVTGAIKNGIKVGIYFYSTAISEEEALEEAAWVVNKIAPYNITYPVVYDFEDFGRYRCVDVDGNKATKNALIFLNYVRSSGYEPMMYANKNDITKKMSRGSFSCKFWLAHYTENTDYKGSFNMWQYTSNGSVPGIKGRVDMDIAYFNYGAIAEAKHKHNYNKLVGKEQVATCEQEGNKTYRCSCGETKTETSPKLGHTFGEWRLEQKPTTEKEGVEKRSCSRCNKEETRNIDKLAPSPSPSISPEPTRRTNSSAYSDSRANTDPRTNTGASTYNYSRTNTGANI